MSFKNIISVSSSLLLYLDSHHGLGRKAVLKSAYGWWRRLSHRAGRESSILTESVLMETGAIEELGIMMALQYVRLLWGSSICR